MNTDDVCLSFNVEPDGNGYSVVTRYDGKPWLRHGPFEDLDYANMICREMIERAERLRERLLKQSADKQNKQDPC